MPRTAAKDLSTYTHAGDFTWREAVDSGRALGVLAVLPCEEMLYPAGFNRDIPNSASASYITVNYDKEYIFEYLHKKIVLGLGFMRGENFNQEGYDRFHEEQKQYSLAENKRDSELEMIRLSQELAAKFGKDSTYWLSTLRSSADSLESEKETSKDINGKQKVKVA